MPALSFNPGRPTRDWLILAAILVVCVPGLVVGIGQRLTTHTMENLAIVTSQETFLRLADGERDTWLITHNDDTPRLEKPPMATWLNLLAWSDLDPHIAPPQQLIFRARCVTVALGMMLLASLFLIARMFGDSRFAAFAVLVVASTFFFQRQARTASYDMHYVAWTVAAIASGLWAMNPLHAAPSTARRIIGWGGCACALFAAAMSKNPLPYALALPPLIAAIVMLSSRRATDSLWLATATIASALPVAWWYWHVFDTYPELARRALSREVLQPRSVYQPVWYYVGVFGLVVPWTLWLIGGLIEPFRIPTTPEKRRRVALLALLWFVLLFVCMSIPAAKQQRYILGILPAVGLLVAMFVRQHDERAASGSDDRTYRMIAAGMWVSMFIASIGGAWFLVEPVWFVAIVSSGNDAARPVVESLSWPLGIALGAVLLVIAGCGWLDHAQRPWRSNVAVAVWMIVFMTAFWRQESRVDDPRVKAFADEAARVRAIVGSAPLRSLRMNQIDSRWHFNEEFRIYFGQLIRRVQPEDVPEWLDRERGDAYIVARSSDAATALLAKHSFERIDSVRIDRQEVQDLWRRRAASGDASITP